MSTNKTVKRTASLAAMALAAVLVYGFGDESLAGVSDPHAGGIIDAYTGVQQGATGARPDFDTGWMAGLTAGESAVPVAVASGGMVWATTTGGAM